MKVGFLAGTLGRGGAEKQLLFMLQALRSEGIEVRVLCLTRNEAYETDIRHLGIDIDWIGSSQKRLARLGALIGNLKKRPVDILQSAHFFTNLYVAAAGRVLGIPSIGAIRNDLASEISANGVFGKWHLKLPSRLIVNSELAFARALGKGICPENIDLVRNVVSETESNCEYPRRENCQILFAGRLVPQKRPQLFIEAASQLRDRLPETNLRFVIAGDGPLRQELEQLARQKELGEKDITFLGEQADMGRVYRESDLLILPSKHEGTPNVILEAMSYGLPVIATKVGGVPEVLGDGCGIQVDPNDTEGLVRAAERLIFDQGLRYGMGRQAQRYVRKNHSVGYLREVLAGVYSDLLGDPATKK